MMILSNGDGWELSHIRGGASTLPNGPRDLLLKLLQLLKFILLFAGLLVVFVVFTCLSLVSHEDDPELELEQEPVCFWTSKSRARWTLRKSNECSHCGHVRLSLCN